MILWGGRLKSFKTIRQRAEKRKGGPKALAGLLPPKPDRAALAAVTDDRALAAITRRVFCAGFVWRVIDNKWPGFEQAFLGFVPRILLARPDEFWEKLTVDTRIVRNSTRIRSVRRNAEFVTEIARQYGSFGQFLAGWPADDQIGLQELLAKRGDRLGGGSGQMLLRFLGWDAFMTSQDVLACMRDAGLDVAEQVTSKRDRIKVQAQFNAWVQESGLPYLHVSRICAMSIGENRVSNDYGLNSADD